MKLKWSDSAGYLGKLTKEHGGLLIYGANRGQISERALAVSKEILGDSLDDPFRNFYISNDVLEQTPQVVAEEAMTVAFGGERKLVRLKNPVNGAVDVVKELLKSSSDLGFGNYFLLVTADELGTGDKWRGLFENSAHVGAVACYINDSDVGNVLGEKLRSAGVSIDKEAMNFLQSRLRGRDSGIIAMEAEKLIIYACDSKRLSLSDVESLCGNSSDSDIDTVVSGCLGGQSLSYLDVGLSSLYRKDVKDIMILRTMVRTLRRMVELKLKIDGGMNFKSAAQSLRPSLFWKLHDNYERALRIWDIDLFYSIILQVQSCELHIKSGYGFEDLLVARLLQRINAMAEKRLPQSSRYRG